MTGNKHIHFIGIGGIGVSALARMYLVQGAVVTGSDAAPSLVTSTLEKLGAKIFVGHSAEHLPENLDLVIYTIAITPDNPELAAAKGREIKTLSYPEALGELSRHKKTIAVTGTHGKTTTTAMLGEIARAAGLDPTVIVGSLLAREKTNFVAGKSDLLIVEACEFRRSFLNLQPFGLIITNIDNDHLDYFRDLADIQSAFAALAAKLPPEGFLVCPVGDPNLAPIIKVTQAKIIDYSQIGGDFFLAIPGAYNILNAKAALGAAGALGVSLPTGLEALNKFSGTWRRFEYRGKTGAGADVYDDYAHHPTAARAVLTVAREKARGKLLVVFQPHLYSRTKLLLEDFAKSFGAADQVFVTDIYAAREPRDPSISSQILVQAIGAKAVYAPDLDELGIKLNMLTRPDDLILTVGAGDIYTLADRLVSGYNQAQ